MRKWPVVGGVLAVAWLFVRGVDPTPVRLAVEIATGLLVGLPIAYVFRWFYLERTPVRRHLRAAPYAVIYVTAFGIELLRANLDVAWRVLAPSLPIRPAVVRFPLRVESDAAITTIANSITLTPGTLTLDYEPEGHALLIHGLAVDDARELAAPIRRWEDYALRIFDEAASPDTAPRERASVVDTDAFDVASVPLAGTEPAEASAERGDNGGENEAPAGRDTADTQGGADDG